MALDELLVRNTREWLARAADDLTLAENAAGQTAPAFLRDALFHCQQAAEKAFKAFLTWHDVPFPRIHDLEEIGARRLQVDASLEPVVDRAAQLSQYAWRFRYPGELEEPSMEEVRRSLQLARETREAVLSRLPAELRQ